MSVVARKDLPSQEVSAIVDFFPTFGFLVGEGVPLADLARFAGLQTQGSSHSQAASHLHSSLAGVAFAALAGDLAGVRLGVAWREDFAGVWERDLEGVLRALWGVDLAGLLAGTASSSGADLAGVCLRDFGLDIFIAPDSFASSNYEPMRCY